MSPKPSNLKQDSFEVFLRKSIKVHY